jgi:NifU-like protein involved in Fe-S cluster formation
MSETPKNTCDVEEWLYSDIVKDHFFSPRNILLDDKGYVADGCGVAGSPLCGDMMVVWITVDKNKNTVTECVWRTFGCASAIASTSMMSVMVTENGGMTLERAKRLSPESIIDRLGGLPDRKYHCSVLGHEALRKAVEDYEITLKDDARK